ncbi:MAG TPA: dihydrolipoamide acetyltransferase family protein [Bacteroidales bacterium]|jgi:pyruvate dehydrogenase E2 component (dihydrolipoamide acetyltransferase)|nr:dihydrolipoamide acetyltransferase family protein [Bacteroidales bacterium]HOL97960.1 dihydrolipoamide acetyltransferase family protein [Bacteroidales bacterium]HPD23532.1 dihydrolipoamide acetyltransferase family protein [Bacteroidales bacterium]HRS99162.1 dihydrolipoamide acetyltransferase family protein [Bacteroidales bacterium]HUM32313.1 dihydrolipoamide acetyltransferase family protein [Bacteroidales bacterium]
MRYIFNFPDIGEGLDEGTILEWYVKKGQNVKVGEPLVKMETDKVVTDIPSPRDGVVAAIYGKVGETIHVGTPLVEIEIEGISGQDAQPEVKNIENQIHQVEEEGAGVVGTLEIASNAAVLPASDEGTRTSTEEKSKNKKALATPVARAYAKELGIDINLVIGTGPAGRVMKEDILKFKQQQAYVAPQNITAKLDSEENRIEVVKMTQLRKTIAKNMIQSKHNAAHMTVFDDAEISELINLRNKFKNKYADEGLKLSYLPFILKATVKALQKFKALNSEMDMENGNIIYKKYYNIGIAVDTEDGLLVPVIRDVDKKNIKQLALEIAEISEKARTRNIKLEDMKDGTFTITSYGSIGGKYAVPVINYPQAAILGIGKIFEAPVVKNGKIEIGNLLPLSLSVDHRIVDGGEVTRFLNTLIEYLTEPMNMLID